MSLFPDRSSRILYQNNILRLFPKLDALLKYGVLSENKMAELSLWVMLWLSDITQAQAVKNIKEYLEAVQTTSPDKKLRVGFTPAGGFFKKVIRELDLTLIDICGAFDHGIKQSYVDRNITFYSAEAISDVMPDVLIISSGTYGQEICNNLISDSDFEKMKIYSPYWEIPLKDNVDEEIQSINNICDVPGKRPVLLFVCLRFYSFLYKRLLAFKKEGIRVILVTLEDNQGHAQDINTVKDACSHVWSANNNFFDFLHVLKNIRPDMAHLFLNAGNSQIPVMASTVFNYPYVVEYNDVLTNMHDRKSLAKAIGKEESIHEFNSEKYLIENSKGLVYNNHESSIHHLFEFYGLNVPAVEFLYYPLSPPSDEINNCDKKIKLIYIGGITRSEYGPLCNYSFRDTINMIDLITAQNFTLDIYNAYDTGTTNDFNEFYEKQEQNPKFNYYKAVHPGELISIMKNYDAGLIVSDYSYSKMKKKVLERTFSSRLFEYFEAGLPVIISKELKYMTSIVEQNSLGIAINYCEISVLEKLLPRAQQKEYSSNVKNYVKTILMQDNINRLISFYNSKTIKQ